MPAPTRRIAVFRNGANQAIRIPREFEIDGTEVTIRREGDSLILTPVHRHRLLELVRQWEPLPPEDDFPDRDDLPPQERGALFE
jgi:antitoxin VapB